MKMKNLFKKYYELSEEMKEILPNLYILHELESLLSEYENITIISTKDKEIIIKVVLECWYYSNIDGGEVIRRILDMLNCRSITIDELLEIDTEALINLITEEETDFKEISNKNIIISEFTYKNLKCAFFKDGTKLILTFERDNCVEVCIFNSFEEILCYLIDDRLKVQSTFSE